MRFEKTEYIEMNYYELEDIFKEVYNIKLSIPANNESHNDTYLIAETSSRGYRGENAHKNMQIYDMINVLHRDGHIPAGKYLISVSW